MDALKAQRICLKFCAKLGKTGTETLSMVQQAFGDSAMSRSKVFEWHKRFKEGRTLLEDDPRHGRPSTSITDESKR